MSAALAGGQPTAGAALLERRMIGLFGVSADDFEEDEARNPIPTAYVTSALRVLDSSGILTLLLRWGTEQRKSSAGRKAVISVEAIITLFLVHVQAGLGTSYKELVKTVRFRLTPDMRSRLGIPADKAGRRRWYKRVWSAADRLVALFDPYPSTLNRKLRGDEWEAFKRIRDSEAYQTRSLERMDRMDDLCNRLVAASLQLLPRDIWERYNGNIAIDATTVLVAGKPNPTSDRARRSNPDPIVGRYRREGSHEGRGAITDETAYELETTAMVWNKPGFNTEFPSLVTAISMHNPGRIIGHGARLIKRHQELGFERILVCADRAYNSGTIETFHIPARRAGAELVIDYKGIELGLQGWFEDAILVDGSWYVHWMPNMLIEASRTLRTTKDRIDDAKAALWTSSRNTKNPTDIEDEHRHIIAENTAAIAKLEKAIANREHYRLIPKGRPDSDGAQRYTYPVSDIAAVTGKTAHDRKSLTIPLLVPVRESSTAPAAIRRMLQRTASSDKVGLDQDDLLEARKTIDRGQKPRQPIRFVQKFPYLSEQWKRHYGMRSLVESSNNLLKDSVLDLDNPRKRSKRGFAFAYLSSALIVVASNIRRIVSFFHTEAERLEAPRRRASRRTDENGVPLRMPNAHPTGAPPGN